MWSLDADYDGHSQDLFDAMYKATVKRAPQGLSTEARAKVGRQSYVPRNVGCKENRFESGQNRPTACPETEHSVSHVE